MNVQKFYQDTNSNYEQALRLMMNDSLIARMLDMFMQKNAYQDIINYYEQKDFKSLFAAVHSFKGVTGNLSITCLYDLSCEITELTRSGEVVNIDNEIQELKKRSEMVVEAYHNCKD